MKIYKKTSLGFLFKIFFWFLIFVFLYFCFVYFGFENYEKVFYFFAGAFAYYFINEIRRSFDIFWDRRMNKIDHGKKGREGEMVVKNILEDLLDDRYEIYKNFRIPGRKFDIDFVIVGPKGIMFFEVKNYSGKIIFYKDKALKQVEKNFYSSGDVYLYGKNDPRNQLMYHAAIFDQYLNDLGFEDIKINKAVIFVKDIVEIHEKIGVSILSGSEKIKDFVDSLDEENRFNKEFCGKINSAFKNAWKA